MAVVYTRLWTDLMPFIRQNQSVVADLPLSQHDTPCHVFMLQATLDASAGNVNAKLIEAAHQMTETIASLEDRCEVLERMVVGEWIR